MRFRHLALFVGDRLREAEAFYMNLFGMELLLREAPLHSGGADASEWAQLPLGRTWDDAERAGFDIGLVALERDELVLALFADEPSGAQVYAIGLLMTGEQKAEVLDRLDGATPVVDADGSATFVDPFGIRWQLGSERRFLGAGTLSDSWFDVN